MIQPQVTLSDHIHPYEGLRVSEVAHDIQQQVSRFVVSLSLTNSYDTWHGNGTRVITDVYRIIIHIPRDEECSKTNAQDLTGESEGQESHLVSRACG